MSRVGTVKVLIVQLLRKTPEYVIISGTQDNIIIYKHIFIYTYI